MLMSEINQRISKARATIGWHAYLPVFAKSFRFKQVQTRPTLPTRRGIIRINQLNCFHHVCGRHGLGSAFFVCRSLVAGMYIYICRRAWVTFG